jgi:hypothetical protein
MFVGIIAPNNKTREFEITFHNIRNTKSYLNYFGLNYEKFEYSINSEYKLLAIFFSPHERLRFNHHISTHRRWPGFISTLT